MPVFAAFGFVKNFDIPTDSLRRAEYQNLAALFIFTVKLFFSGPRIRIIAEDNANAEGAVTYRCNTQVLKQYCLFRAETQWFFYTECPQGMTCLGFGRVSFYAGCPEGAYRV